MARSEQTRQIESDGFLTLLLDFGCLEFDDEQ